MRGKRCGATIFYAICDTRVMTKNTAKVLSKCAWQHLAASIIPSSAPLHNSKFRFSTSHLTKEYTKVGPRRGNAAELPCSMQFVILGS